MVNFGWKSARLDCMHTKHNVFVHPTRVPPGMLFRIPRGSLWELHLVPNGSHLYFFFFLFSKNFRLWYLCHIEPVWGVVCAFWKLSSSSMTWCRFCWDLRTSKFDPLRPILPTENIFSLQNPYQSTSRWGNWSLNFCFQSTMPYLDAFPWNPLEGTPNIPIANSMSFYIEWCL